MRIGFVTSEFVTSDHYGGLGTYLYKTCSYLKNVGYQPVVIVFGDKDESYLYEEIEVHAVTRKMEILFWILNGLLLFTLNTSLRIYFSSKRINKRLKKLNKQVKFDIVQYSNAQFLSLTSPTNIKTVLRLSHYYREYFKYIYSDPNSWKNIQKKAIEHVILHKHKGHIIGPSKTINKIVKKNTGLDVTHVPSSFPPKPVVEIGEIAQKSTILYFGTYSFSKGSDLLIKVIPKVLEEHPDWSFVSAGRDTSLKQPYSYGFLNKILKGKFKMTYTQKLKQSLSRFGDRVQIEQKLPYSKIAQLLHQSKIVVLPSRIDNSPNTLTEALSLNKIVIASENSSLDELIEDGENGFLFRNGDSQSFLEVVSKVIDGVESYNLQIQNKFVNSEPNQNVENLLMFYNSIQNK